MIYIEKLSPPFNYKQFSTITKTNFKNKTDAINVTLLQIVGGWMFNNYYNNFSIDEKIKELKTNYINIIEK